MSDQNANQQPRKLHLSSPDKFVGFLDSLSKISESAIVTVDREKTSSLVASTDNTLILYAEYNAGADFYSTLNIPDVKKLTNVLKTVGFDDEIDLRELFSVLWDGKVWISAITAAAAVISVLVALWLPNIYESKALLAPKSAGGSGELSRLASQYSGLASLAGINLSGVGGGDVSKAALAQEKLKSLSFFTEHLYSEVLVDLMAVDYWDAYSGEIVVDADVYNQGANKWVREVSYPYQTKPSPQEAHKEFLELIAISEDKQSGFISLKVEHESPFVAKAWADMLIDRINEEIRAEDVGEAEASIAFLEAQREQTSLVSLDEVFAQLIEEQTKTIMLANVSKDYVFNIIDPAVVPELKSKPFRALICVLGTLLGGVLGIVCVLVRHYMRSKD